MIQENLSQLKLEASSKPTHKPLWKDDDGSEAAKGNAVRNEVR